jgi:hypothetical protein
MTADKQKEDKGPEHCKMCEGWGFYFTVDSGLAGSYTPKRIDCGECKNNG